MHLFFKIAVLLVAVQCILLPLHSFCQKHYGVLKGKVTDANGQPAANVTIELKTLKRATVTDDNGLFVLQHLPHLDDTLVISSINAKPIMRIIKIADNTMLNIGTINLEYYIKQLQDVEIEGRTARSYKSDYSFFGTKTETPSKDIPQSISTVTKELMKDKMEFTLKDAVDEVAGVNQYSGYDEYIIRGFRAENARDINGLRGYNTTYISNMLVNVERVEVIKGPTATLYGNCDPGGTINLITKKPLQSKEAELDVYGGSYNHFSAMGDVTGPLNQSKTLLYRFNAGYDNTQSFRTGFYAKQWQLAPSFTYIPNDKLQVNVDFSLSHINTVLDRGQPGLQNNTSLSATPISLSLTQPGDYLHETDIASTITASYKINNNLSFTSGFLNYVTVQNVADHGLNDYITPDSVSLYYANWNYKTVTNTLTNYLTYKFHTGHASHQLLVGYDYICSKVTLNQQYYEIPDQFGVGSGIVGTFSLKHPQYFKRPVDTYQESGFDSDGTDVNSDIYHTQGVYVQNEIRLHRWILLLSLREEFYKGDEQDDSTGNLREHVFLPRVGIVYALKPNVSLYATYNNGFDPFEASTSTQVFNQPFKPITSQLLEAGVKANFLRNRLSASVALYQLTLQNVAVNANDISNPNLFIQQGEDRSKGVEAEASGNILPNLSITVSYAYNVAKVTKSKIAEEVGMRVENAPLNTSGSWLKYTFSKGVVKGFGISVGHSAVGVRNTLDPDIILPSYLVINGGLHYTHNHFVVALNVNNITNTVYWQGAYNNVNKWPGAPRNFMLNVGYRL